MMRINIYIYIRYLHTPIIEERGKVKKKDRIGWKESGRERGRLCVGKEPKEPLGSAEEIRQREKGEAKSMGGTS